MSPSLIDIKEKRGCDLNIGFELHLTKKGAEVLYQRYKNGYGEGDRIYLMGNINGDEYVLVRDKVYTFTINTREDLFELGSNKERE